jgi:small subunit ribosomal protein S4
VLYGEVCVRPEELPSWTTWSGSEKVLGIRNSASGKTESQKDVDRQKGITGETLLSLLERRLDNIVYRLGFANSRNEARQLVRHKHFIVNQSKVDIPSYLVKPGDVIQLREKSKKVVRILEALEGVARRGVPQWLELDKDQMKGGVKGLPTREDITIPIQEKLIVELFSK